MIGVLLDGLVSFAATARSDLEPLSNVLSTAVLLASTVVLIFALIGRLHPKAVFAGVATAYLAVAAFGFVIVAALAAKLGPEKLGELGNQQISVSYIAQQLPWYMPVHWVLITVVTLAGAGGLVLYLKGSDTV